MPKKHDFLFNKYFQYFSILFLVFYIVINATFCIRYTDFDYPIKKKLNNGQYLVMTTRGIYIFNEDFSSNITKVKFKSRLFESNDYTYSEDIAQFLGEDGGYIICLIRNITFVLSKNADYLSNLTLDNIEYRVGYQIVPYDHSGSNYYYAIISAKPNYLIINNYIFHSSDNSVEFEGKYNYSSPFNYNLEVISLSCKLMKYLNNKVIFCFYGEYNKAYYVILNITTFEPISEREGEIPITNFPGGMYFHSDAIFTSREKIVCCNGRCGSVGSSLVCFGYNINSMNFQKLKLL